MMSEEELFNKVDSGLSFITSLNNEAVELMFNKVDNYVKSNYLFINSEDKYYLKYNGRFYIIGFFTGPEILYYIRICNDKNVNEYVDYNDFKYGKINEDQQDIKNQIDGINDTIRQLEEKGVSRRLLKKSINL